MTILGDTWRILQLSRPTLQSKATTIINGKSASSGSSRECHRRCFQSSLNIMFRPPTVICIVILNILREPRGCSGSANLQRNWHNAKLFISHQTSIPLGDESEAHFASSQGRSSKPSQVRTEPEKRYRSDQQGVQTKDWRRRVPFARSFRQKARATNTVSFDLNWPLFCRTSLALVCAHCHRSASPGLNTEC